MDTLRPSPVTPTISLDDDGARHGFLRLPWSRDESAWGALMLPISVIVNGSGPTALLVGGNHGDEYEGPIVLRELALRLGHSRVRGRIIVLPALNLPALEAGTRISPIDGSNMNRTFPGRPDGNVTERIADYVTRELVPRSDVVLDYHAGGRTLDFLPFAAAHVLEDKTQEAACVAAMRAFNAPYSMRLLEIDSGGMFDTTVEGQGKVFVTTEIHGGGTTTPESLRIARKGVYNVLRHADIIEEDPVLEPSIDLDMPDGDCFLFAEHAGLVEPLVDLGAAVKKGEPLARIWPLERTGVEPVSCHARRAGLLTARHFPGRVRTGDCLAVIAERV